MSALKSPILEIFYNQKLGLAPEQRTGFSVLKAPEQSSEQGEAQPAETDWVDLGQAGLMAAFQLQGWLQDTISGTSYFSDLQIMGKEFANFLKLNSSLRMADI